MLGDIVKFVIMVIALNYLQKIIKDINKRKKEDPNENDNEFKIRISDVLLKVYSIIGIVGIMLFFVFLFVKYVIHGSVDDGCFIFAMIFSGIGWIVAAYSWKWRIIVNGNQMEIQRLFHKSKKIKINEIEKVIKETKTMHEVQRNRIVIYKDGCKLIAVEDMLCNYERLLRKLKEYGKIN